MPMHIIEVRLTQSMHTTNVVIMEDKPSMKTEVKEERSSATSLGLCYCI